MNVYAIIAVAAISLGGVYYVSALRDKVDTLETEVETQKLQIKIHADNVILLTNQLAFEKQNQEIGDDAVSELKQEVPKLDFNTPLPASIQSVLDGFHSRIRP